MKGGRVRQFRLRAVSALERHRHGHHRRRLLLERDTKAGRGTDQSTFITQGQEWVVEIKHISSASVPVLKVVCSQVYHLIKQYLSKKIDITIQSGIH